MEDMVNGFDIKLPRESVVWTEAHAEYTASMNFPVILKDPGYWSGLGCKPMTFLLVHVGTR